MSLSWWTHLTQRAGRLELGAGQVEALRWRYARHLPDNLRHRHTHYELCLVGREGGGLFHVGALDFRLAPGDLFLARPGIWHQIVNIQEPPMELSWVAFRVQATAGQPLPGALPALVSGPAVVVPDSGGRVAAAWGAMREMGPWCSAPAFGHLIGLFFFTAADAFRGPAHAPLAADGRPCPPLAARIGRYIDEHLEQPVGMGDLAQELGLSRRQASRVVGATMGAPFRLVLRDARLARARFLLSCTTLSVREVAAEVGFCSASHFSRTFAAAAGRAPLAYRREGGLGSVGPGDRRARDH